MNKPIQPLMKDAQGVLRFKDNKIVWALLTHGQRTGLGLNELSMMDFEPDDWQQMAQLIGYSLSGYGELSYVTGDAYGVAAAMADDGLTEEKARIAYLEAELAALRGALRDPMARLFGVHPDDLNGG